MMTGKCLKNNFGRNELEYIPAYETVPVAWMWEINPLSQKKSVTADEIGRWPVISYEALSPGTAILSGNIDFGHSFSKNIHLSSDSDIACILESVMGIYISGKISEERKRHCDSSCF